MSPINPGFEGDTDFFKSHTLVNGNLMKSKPLPVGTKRKWAGKEYQKTAQGWKPVKSKFDYAALTSEQEKKVGQIKQQYGSDRYSVDIDDSGNQIMSLNVQGKIKKINLGPAGGSKTKQTTPADKGIAAAKKEKFEGAVSSKAKIDAKYNDIHKEKAKKYKSNYPTAAAMAGSGKDFAKWAIDFVNTMTPDTVARTMVDAQTDKNKRVYDELLSQYADHYKPTLLEKVKKAGGAVAKVQPEKGKILSAADRKQALDWYKQENAPSLSTIAQHFGITVDQMAKELRQGVQEGSKEKKKTAVKIGDRVQVGGQKGKIKYVSGDYAIVDYGFMKEPVKIKDLILLKTLQENKNGKEWDTLISNLKRS